MVRARVVFNPDKTDGVALDKSEGAVKDKTSPAMRQHRDSRQRR